MKNLYVAVGFTAPQISEERITRSARGHTNIQGSAGGHCE